MSRARDPLRLLVLVAAFALTGYAVLVLGPEALLDRDVWWQSILVWFVGAFLLHDLLLFPLVALADRSLGAGLAAVRGRGRAAPAVPVVNHVRVPALVTGLTFLLFFPGILEQGAETYRTATGQTQEPFLARWLLLVAAAWALSAVLYAARAARARRRPGSGPERDLDDAAGPAGDPAVAVEEGAAVPARPARRDGDGVEHPAR